MKYGTFKRRALTAQGNQSKTNFTGRGANFTNGAIDFFQLAAARIRQRCRATQFRRKSDHSQDEEHHPDLLSRRPTGADSREPENSVSVRH